MDMSTLIPHGACLLWKPEWIWLNAISDALIGGAFFATAFVLGFFVWRRRSDVMFRSVFWAFAIFVGVCGVTRLLSILTLWVPAYGIEGVTKGFLALISVGITAVLLMLLPRILVLPTRIQLRQAYEALEEEVRLRRSAEAMVQRFREIEATESQVRQSQKMESDRSAHGWRRPRLQQHSHRDHRNHRNPRRGGQGPSASRPDHRHDRRRGSAGRRPHQASAGLLPPSAAAAAQR
jgi:hypothetical protein